MEYPPHALELIREALEKGNEFRNQHERVSSYDVARKYLAYMSQFCYRWFDLDPTVYELTTIDKSEDGAVVNFECKDSGALPRRITRAVSHDFGQVLHVAKSCSNFSSDSSEKVWKGAAMLGEVALRILPSISEVLQTVAQSGSRSSTFGEFERSSDYLSIWIRGQESKLSEPQSRFLKALDKSFPNGATWETIQKIAPGFTHAKASDVFKGNKGGAELRRMILLSGDVWKLQSKPVLKVIDGTAI